jgi:hypothetical protein
VHPIAHLMPERGLFRGEVQVHAPLFSTAVRTG